MFEDWSAQLVSGDGKEFFAKDGFHGLLPLPPTLGRRNALWMKSARLVSLFLSLLSIAIGLVCWSRFSAIHAGYVHDMAAGISFNISQLSQLSHLVLVAGHAVVMADSLEHIVHKESDWFLEAYQRGQDLPQALVSHIKARSRQKCAQRQSKFYRDVLSQVCNVCYSNAVIYTSSKRTNEPTN